MNGGATFVETWSSIPGRSPPQLISKKRQKSRHGTGDCAHMRGSAVWSPISGGERRRRRNQEQSSGRPPTFYRTLIGMVDILLGVEHP
ncbi:hypothetical protein M413DRAFT_81930 [Hebeloma cylindrosporum]|uniref:Uncharacterized protein n=1 Tax=Hebeloma cylindrosporum TaxID=76867 RepID=A0A0C3CWU7_HEBCY|nr:hypothetical protein M413DRAFT_81930 [Hebeloma cylindrosporum h7]